MTLPGALSQQLRPHVFGQPFRVIRPLRESLVQYLFALSHEHVCVEPEKGDLSAGQPAAAAPSATART